MREWSSVVVDAPRGGVPLRRRIRGVRRGAVQALERATPPEDAVPGAVDDRWVVHVDDPGRRQVEASAS